MPKSGQIVLIMTQLLKYLIVEINQTAISDSTCYELSENHKFHLIPRGPKFDFMTPL